MSNRLWNFEPGPLDVYRKRASFDWKKLKIFLDSEDLVNFELDIYEEFKKNGIRADSSESLPTEKQKRLATERMIFFGENPLFSFDLAYDDFRKPYIQTITRYLLDASPLSKHSICFELVFGTIKTLGTKRHMHYLQDIKDRKIMPCFCLTEVGRGSNIKGMRTTAIYDKETQEFVLNSPDFEAAKCWAGNLGKTATHAIVYAQLITPDGINHGLHVFVVKIRDPETLLPYPGIIIGDIGEKIGLNGVDNGFMIFNNYRISRTDLLNKTSDVTEDGKYMMTVKDPKKEYSALLSRLSNGRVNITVIGTVYLVKALTIAIRYAAVRKQFGPNDKEEIPILEYPVHQNRLLPYLAVAYAHKIFSAYLIGVQTQLAISQYSDDKSGKTAELVKEMHAVSSASKSFGGWIVRDGIQECREACGGHGYLKAAGLGDLRNTHDPNNTYEGDSHVLTQQTSNWLLKFWPTVNSGKSVSSPLGSINFLSDVHKVLQEKFKANSVEELIAPQALIGIYKWLTCYLLKSTNEKLEQFQKQGRGAFWSKHESQVFYAKPLCIVFIQHFILEIMYKKINETQDNEIKNALIKLFSLYGVWNLEKHLPHLYKSGYVSSGKLTILVEDAIIKLCADIKNDAVSLIDVIAPPDFLLNSVLGYSDGQVYRHLQSIFFHSPNNFGRPSWWKEVIQQKKNIESKL